MAQGTYTVNEYWWPIFVVCVVTVGAVLHLRRARRIVEGWAAANDLTIVEQHPMWFRVSPWPFVGMGHQTVRYLTVRERQGLEHRCWLLIGNFWWGLTDSVKVVWES